MRLFFSMMKGIGVDLFCLDRIDLKKEYVISRILSKKEYEIMQRLNNDQAKKEFFGSRFAAKEAYIKACHQKKAYQDIEILNRDNGEPYFSNDRKAHLSISHETQYAVAFVVIEE